MVRTLIDLFKTKRRQRQANFENEVTEAFTKLNSKDKDLLCRAFDKNPTPAGLYEITRMTRKELAAKCAPYYVRLTGKEWNVLEALRDVVHNIRTGK